jgi:hypothetical protein
LVCIYRLEYQQQIFARGKEEYEHQALVAESIKIRSADQRKKSGSLYVLMVGGVDVACQAPRGVVMASFHLALHLYIFYGILNCIWYSGTQFPSLAPSKASQFAMFGYICDPFAGKIIISVSLYAPCGHAYTHTCRIQRGHFFSIPSRYSSHLRASWRASRGSKAPTGQTSTRQSPHR